MGGRGHVKFHAASRGGVTLNFDTQVVGGGSG